MTERKGETEKRGALVFIMIFAFFFFSWKYIPFFSWFLKDYAYVCLSVLLGPSRHLTW